MDAHVSLLVTLVVYKVVLLSIGWWAAGRSHDGAGFYLGGRGLGPWVAAISAAASSSSAWTLLGVSGAAYARGLSAFWLLPACFSGFLLNWLVVARPLQREAARCGAVTLTEFLAADSKGRQRRALILCASVIVLLSLGVYVASQFQAAGKTFAETLDMDFRWAVVVGAGIVMIYTMSGGFWAASVSDLVQGLVMAAACVLVPVAALIKVGGFGAMMNGLEQAGPAFASWTGDAASMAAIGMLVGTFGIALGYPGQPHVVNRFMALRSPEDIRRGTVISLVWAFLVYGGMLLAGWCARALVTQLGDSEAVLLRLTTDLFPPVVAGVVIAAVLSAIMSTADSQLLVCGSTVAYDLPGRSARRRVGLDRWAVVGISAVAILAAMFVRETIFNQVLFAWSALGAAFGPLLLVRLLHGPVRPGAALASMLIGFAVTLVWFFIEVLNDALYELVPAFAAALVPAWLGRLPRVALPGADDRANSGSGPAADDSAIG